MSSKLIFLLLTALLLVQCSVGKAMPDADTAAEVSKEEETKKESDAGALSDKTSEENSEERAFMSFFLGEITEIGDETLNSVKKVMENVIADVNAMEEKSESLKIKTDQLAELLSILDKIDLKNKNKRKDWNLDLLHEINAFLNTLNTTAIEKSEADNLIFIASFQKHGIQKIVKDVTFRVLEFTGRLYRYLNSLSPEVLKSLGEKMDELHKLLKEETDLEKKFMLLNEFFEMNEKQPKNQEKEM